MNSNVSGKRRLSAVHGAAMMTVLGLAPLAHAVTYTATNIGALIGGSESTSNGTSLNSLDQVGGYYNTTGGSGSLPFVYTPGIGGTSGTVTTVPGVGQGYTSEVNGINAAGLAVGIDGSTQNSFTYNVNTHAFATVSKGGNYSITLTGINNLGVASGYIQGTAATFYADQAISYNTLTGVSSDVSTGFSGTPVNGQSTPAQGINDLGQIIGYGVNKASTFTAAVPFIATPNGLGGFTYKDLSTSIIAADPTFSAAGFGQFIDALGNAAGNYNTGRFSGSAYLYNAVTGTSTAILPPSGNFSVTVEGFGDVNGVPEIVGDRRSYGNANFAMTDVNGVMTDISGVVPGFTLTDALGVNSRGDIVATGTPIGGGNAQAFLLTVPVPEPTSLAVLIATPLVFARRRRA